MEKLLSDPIIIPYLKDQINVLVFIIDRKSNIHFSNHYAQEILGQELLDRANCFEDLFVDFVEKPDLTELTADPHSSHMLQLKTSNHVPQTYYFNFLEKDEYILVFGQQNEKEHQLLHTELLRANAEVNNLVRDLQKSKIKALELNEQKNQVIGIAAHDLRNPAGIVFQYSEFLLDEMSENLSEQQQEIIHYIRNSGQFMLTLLDDLLDVSQIEAGKLDLQVSAVDTLPFIREIVSLNQVFAHKKGQRLIFSSNGDPGTASFDPTKITQVLNNLISNASKYSPVKSEIHVKLEQNERHLVFSVRDSGPGIPEHEIGDLFKAFQKSSAKATGGEKSVGLGLAIVKRIIEGHKGEITVQSELGKWTIFSFSLPVNIDYKSKNDAIGSRFNGNKIGSSAKKKEQTKQNGLIEQKTVWLDLKVFEELISADKETLKNLVDTYVEQTSKSIELLKNQKKGQQASQAIGMLDQIKGASASLGAMQMVQICDQLLSGLGRSDVGILKGYVVTLEALFKKTVKIMQDHLRSKHSE